MPQHAWLVHAPIGLAMALPFALAGCAWLAWSRRAAWWLAVVAAAAVAITAQVASSAGESEVQRYRAHPELGAVIEAHEHAADRFSWAAAALAVVCLVTAAVKADRARRSLYVVCAALAVGLAPLIWEAGHLGGAVVWMHDAPSLRAKD